MSDVLDLQSEVRELFAKKMKEFATFCGEKWTLTEKDMAELQPWHGEEYRQGYNAALTDGLEGALNVWLEEDPWLR